jgi:hypothetical protein
MTKHSLLALSVGIAISGGVFAQSTTTKPGSRAVTDVPSTAQPFSPLATITEGFDGSATTTSACLLTPAMATAGWFAKNNSLPNGASCWNVIANTPVPTAPAPQAGAGFIVSNFNVGTGAAQHSAWLVTPRVTFGPGATLEFWARAGGTYADQMEVRVSTAADAGTPNVGTAATDLGTFTSLALTINPTSALVSTDQACPTANFTATGATHPGFATSQWCKFTVSGAALPASGSGRIAFRNSVPDGGPGGANSSIIRMDSFSFVEGITSTPIISSPISGSQLSFSVPIGSTASQTINFTGGPATLNCTVTGPYSIPAGGVVNVPGALVVTASGAASGTLTCTGPAGFTTSFALGSSFAVQAPALNMLGMLALLAGIALVGTLAVRRFS